MYDRKQTPLKYGIMFTDEPYNHIQTTWYDSEEQRDKVANELLTVGEFLSNIDDQPVKVYSFTAVEANDWYYKRNGR